MVTPWRDLASLHQTDPWIAVAAAALLVAVGTVELYLRNARRSGWGLALLGLVCRGRAGGAAGHRGDAQSERGGAVVPRIDADCAVVRARGRRRDMVGRRRRGPADPVDPPGACGGGGTDRSGPGDLLVAVPARATVESAVARARGRPRRRYHQGRGLRVRGAGWRPDLAGGQFAAQRPDSHGHPAPARLVRGT